MVIDSDTERGPDTGTPPPPEGRARWLVASNALDAGGRSATDVALGERRCIPLGSVGCAVAVGLHLLAYADRAHAGPWLLAGAALWGFMVLLGNITQAAVTARACPEGTLGRVTAMRRTLTRGSVPLATLAGGALGATLGVGWALAGWQVLAVVSLAAVVPAARWVDAGLDDVD